jgi:hypothetical protein
MQMVPENNMKARLKSQIQSLRSGNRSAIIATLKEVRTSGSVAILPDMLELLAAQEDEQITFEVLSLLNDLNDQEAVPILVEAIGKPEYADHITELVAACWQNGLSYGKYADRFVDVALHGEYAAAIEAFTVIEEAVGELEESERQDLIQTIKLGIQETSEQKKPLLSELVKVIANY